VGIADLSDFAPDAPLTADVVIIGGGPAGYAVAAGLKDLPLEIVVLESGLEDWSEAHEALNTVDSVGEPAGVGRVARRTEFHMGGMSQWAAEQQGFGVRRRGLGGSSEVWAGKSAAFDDLDFNVRPWMAYSGWPFPKSHLQPFIDRAAEMLNLGPNHYDEKLWDAVGVSAPEPLLNPQILRSFFWQFARARHDRLDFMRFKRAFTALDTPKVRIVLNATVRCLYPTRSGACIQEAEATTLAGAAYRIRARTFVLATGAIETPRLLLNSGRLTGHPFGNAHDLVGRFLMDHPSATIGQFRLADCGAINRRFGFYGISHSGQTHMYQHGLVLSPEVQRREGLLNCAAYMMEQRAPDDPWEAIKRLLRHQSVHLVADALAVLMGSGLVLRGVGSSLAARGAWYSRVNQRLIDMMIRRPPNAVVREFRDRGLPHKLTGISIDAITEQRPDPNSRIVLGERLDPLGVPVPRIDWRIDEQATRSLMRMGQLIDQEFARAGLPQPILESWVVKERAADGQIIDMAHTAGTTRMGERPELGVVDPHSGVFGFDNLYVAGASVFPTIGHANPTLMILAMAIRLADHLKSRLREPLHHPGPMEHARGASCA
jgi:choline dehydrogenase-like flavoprotein